MANNVLPIQELETPIKAKTLSPENVWVFNWRVCWTKKSRQKYLQFSLYCSGVLVPGCRLMGGKVYPPQTLLGRKYLSIVRITRATGAQLYKILEQLLFEESLTVGLDPDIDIAMNSWYVSEEELNKL